MTDPVTNAPPDGHDRANAAVDAEDRRRAMYVWPLLFVCSFWVPGWVLLSKGTARGGLAQRHARAALVLFVAMYILDALWLGVITSGAVAIGWLLWGTTTAGAIAIAARGWMSARRAPLQHP